MRPSLPGVRSGSLSPVPLERQLIEKKDFPIGRRGYDPEAVDAHLAAVADQVDELKSSSRRRTETLASTASAQVQAIVEAAETSAAAITRQAEEDASDIRADASQEAAASREQATNQAREYVGRVSESTSVMLQRLDAMESELGALLESLKTGSNRLNADLSLLAGNLDEVRVAISPRAPFESEASPGPDVADVAPEAAVEEPVTEVEMGDVEEVETSSAPTPAAGQLEDDTEGARLVALNMALNGTSREETDRYLAENFELGDRTRLLDEVYASVEG
jgi:DivIVA domain-containing protein